MTDLHRVLADATDHVRSPDLTGRALASASRRRARRTSLGALAVVVLLGGGVAWAVQDRVPRGVVDRPSPSPTPTQTPSATDELDALLALPTPPPVPDDVVQPRWDPTTVSALPHADAGLPLSLDPPVDVPELNSMPPAVAMVEGGQGLMLVDRDGGWWRLPVPEAALEVDPYVRTSRLSTDGTRVVFLGRTALWSRDVRSTSWRELAYPEGFLRRDAQIPLVLPLVAEHAWLGRGNRSWFVDLDTATVEEHRTPLASTVWGDGTFVTLDVAADYPMRLLSWGQLDAPMRTFRVDSLESIVGLAVTTGSVAAVRGGCVGDGAPGDALRDGLVALDLDDLSTRAFLPVRDPGRDFSCGHGLQAVAWLDPDAVLVSVNSLADDAGTRRRVLVTWDVETGALARVSSLRDIWAYDIAATALASVPPPG